MTDAEASADEAAARVLREEAADRLMTGSENLCPWDSLPKELRDDWVAVLKRAIAVREQVLADDAKVSG